MNKHERDFAGVYSGRVATQLARLEKESLVQKKRWYYSLH